MGKEVRMSEQNFLPSVSVIIPIYNAESDLPELLKCLTRQTYPTAKVEYLLVDNNSCDRTSEILAQAAGEATTQGINLHHLSANQIQSSYAARNTGIKASRGEILAFTDADCRPQADWLAELVQPFTQPQVGIVAGEIASLPGTNLLEKYADAQDVLSQKHTLNHSFSPYGQTANLAIRRVILEKVGLFRPYLTTGGDADICWRIVRETNWRIEFAPQAIIRHRHRATLTELRSQWLRYGRSNRYLHELHGIDLQRQVTVYQSIHRLSRWLLKELPSTGIAALQGKASLVDVLKTPLDLFTVRARIQGQQAAKFPENAREIEWLELC